MTALRTVRVEWKDGRMQEAPGSEFEMKADLVFLAMGFTNPLQQVLDALQRRLLPQRKLFRS